MKKKAGSRPAGGARGLLQFAAWLLLDESAEKHWTFIRNGDDKRRLWIAASMARWDGAKLLRGHDTLAEKADMEIAQEAIIELAHWCSTKLSTMLLLQYQVAKLKQLKGFKKVLERIAQEPEFYPNAPDRRWDPTTVSDLLHLCMVIRLNRAGVGIIGLNYGPVGVGLVNHFVLAKHPRVKK